MKMKKFISFTLSVALLFSSLMPMTKAAENRRANQENLVQKFKLQKYLKNFKEVDARRALIQKFGNVSIVDDNFDNMKPEPKEDDNVRIIVEFDNPTALDLANSKNVSLKNNKQLIDDVKVNQTKLIYQISKFGKVRHTYQSVLNGVSLTVKYRDIDAIRKIKGVKKVTVVNKYYLDMSTAVNITNSPTVWNELGFKGEGTVVSIVDTGIDYTHKDMKLTDPSKAKLNKNSITEGPGKFFTDKVPYGYNYADMNTDIIDKSGSMHGMHVAGIVAANGEIKGVAPEAQVLALKVFSNDPANAGAFTDDIAAAIDDSVKHGADVINMSLGSSAGFVMPDDPEQRAIKNATDAGVVVVVSAGNSYYSTYPYVSYAQDPDTSIVGSPGLFPDTIQVASSENTHLRLPALTYVLGNETGDMGYTISEIDPVGVLKGEYELVYCNLGLPQDFEGKDLTGKIALIKRGAITFVEKKLNAQAAGAVGVIVFNRDGDNSYINMATDPSVKIPAVFINNADGVKLLNNIENGVKVKFQGKQAVAPNSNADKMSDFSSWGPTPDLNFKPDLTAPGGQIYSTVNANKYETMSGTSMAAPHTSGAVALVVQYLKSKNMGLTPREFVELAKRLLTNTAEPMIDKAVGLPYLTRKQGAGLIKVDKAIRTNVTVSTEGGRAVAALKEVSNQTTFKLKLTNFGQETYTFNLVDKYGVLTTYQRNGLLYPNAMKLTGASISFSENEVTVAPNETKEVTVTLNVPESAPSNIFVEGFISLIEKDSKNPELVMPYMGFYGEWDKVRIFDAPMWDENSYYAQTTLVDSIGFYLGVDGYNEEYGMPIINPKYIAISPNGDSMFDGVMPLVSFLRNAKEFKIEVLDSNKNVLRTISYDKNIRKNRVSEEFPAKYNFDWVWDGMLYDEEKDEYFVAPEGQYFIRLLGKVDFEGAEWTELTMPVKVDLTQPEVEVLSGDKPTGLNKYDLEFEGNDNLGIMYYLVAVNENYDNIIEFKPTDELKLSVDLENGLNVIEIVAVDYAGNFQIKRVEVDNSLIKFNVDRVYYTNQNDVSIEYTFDDSIRYFVDDVKVFFDGEEVEDNNKLEFKELTEGEHNLIVRAYAYNSLITEGEVKIVVDTTMPTITPGYSGSMFDSREVWLSGEVSEMVKSLKINGQEVPVEPWYVFDGVSDEARLVYMYFTEVNFEKDGVNRIYVEVEDLAGNKNSFAYKVFVDTTAPVIEFEGINDGKVKVSKDVDKYTVKLNVSDEVFGYRLYVNGNQIAYEESEVGNGVSKSYTYDVKLKDGVNKVTFRAVDLFGFETVKTVEIIKDSNAPMIEITSPESNATFETKKVTLKGRVTDNDKIEWVKVNNEVVTLNENGEFEKELTFSEFGQYEIVVTAKDEAGNVSTQIVNVNLVKPHVVSIELTKDKNAVERGETAQFKAVAKYSDGSEVDVTDTAVWTSTAGTIEKGLFTAPKDFSGNVTVKVSLEGVEATSNIEVKVPVVKSLELKADNYTFLFNNTANLTVTATYSDGTVKDVTSEVNYVVSDPTMISLTGNKVKGLKHGEVKIYATLDGVNSNEIKLNVIKPAEVIKKIINVIARKLNIRKSATVNSQKLGTFSYGAEVEYLEVVNGWYKIIYNGDIAYVSAKYVKPTTKIIYNNDVKEKKVTTTVALNVRKGASTKYRRIGVLKKNTQVTVLEKVNGWYKINYNGDIAYISAKYVKPTTTTIYNNDVKEKKVTTTVALNVRKGASTKYRRIGVLKKNTQVTVLEKVNGWYKINYNGKIGYIYAKYTK
jgi:lactocepin